MKARRYHLALIKHSENLSGVSWQEILDLKTHVPPFKPTVGNVRETVQALFPAFPIDERWQTIREQIMDSAAPYEFFTIAVQPADVAEFESYCVEFLEV